jgi:hypothetical protein
LQAVCACSAVLAIAAEEERGVGVRVG